MARVWGFILVALLCCIGSAAEAQVTPTNSIDCITLPLSGTGHCSAYLRTTNYAFTQGSYLTVGGYFAQADSGGGLFQAGAPGSCATIGATTTTSGATQGSNTVTLSTATAATVGMSIISATSGGTSGFVFPYDVIANIDSTHTILTLETPVALTTTGAVTLTIGQDNGGSVIADGETSPRCFYRSSWQYNPKEWGASEDSSHDDTVPLQSWLNSSQRFIGHIGGVNPPYELNQTHIASAGYYNQAATSIISFPLTCQAQTTIQGQTNRNGAPYFTIAANPSSTFSTSSSTVPVLYADSYCRISGIGINGNGVADGIDVIADNVTIDGYTWITNGYPYGVKCQILSAPHSYGLIVKDSYIAKAYDNGIYIPGSCPNVRLIGNIVGGSGAGQNSNTTTPCTPELCAGILFGATEGTIANGVIEESYGAGLYLRGTQVSVNAMHIQGNGLGAGAGAGIIIDHAQTVSVCGNHMEGNGGEPPASGSGVYTAHIFFTGKSSDINFCGNVYEPEAVNAGNQYTSNPPYADASIRPQYVYDIDTTNTTVLNNTHFYDDPAPQASGGVYSPPSLLVLQQLQVPHVPRNELNGLVLSNDATATKIDITQGEASDSAQSASIILPYSSSVPTGGCTVDLALGGAAGLDTGAGTGAATTTYFYYLIGTSSGGSPACMASTSGQPTFLHTGTTYTTTINGQTQAGYGYIYNVDSVAGLAPGNVIPPSSPYIGTNQTIVSVGTVTSYSVGSIAATGAVTISTGSTNIQPGMTVTDGAQYAACTGTAANLLNSGIYTVATVSSSTSFTITPVPPGSSSSDCLVVSGGNTVQLSGTASSATTGAQPFTVYNGLYRMLGALYTDGSGNVVKFTQDGNTFYLQTPAEDINTNNSISGNPCNNGMIGSGAVACQLSVPCGLNLATCSTGIKVEAFGRLVGGGTPLSLKPTLISSYDQTTPGAPTGFPGVTGYSTNISTANTSFPFRSYTDTNGKVRVQGSSSGSNSVFELTDGWVLDRSLH